MHNSASIGSVGHVLPERYNSQPDAAKRQPEIVNTNILCSLSVTRNGTLLTNDAIVAPMPRATKVMGKAQQTMVPIVVNSASQVRRVSLSSSFFFRI